MNFATYFFGQDRFARRLLLHKPQKLFIVNVNIHITNNIITNNHLTNNNLNLSSNSKSFQQHQQDEQRHILKTQKLVTDIASGKL